MADGTGDASDLPTAPPAPKLPVNEPFGPGTRVITKDQAPEQRRLRLQREAAARDARRKADAPVTDAQPTTRAGMLVKNFKAGRDLLSGGGNR